MKKLLVLFSLVIIGFVYFTGQKTDESPRWYYNPQMIAAQKNGEQLPQATDIGVKSWTTDSRIVYTPQQTLAISPSIRVYPSLNQQCEIYITRDPSNPQILYVASQNISGGASINAGTYVSTDGGLTWKGSDTLAAPSLADQRGDPGPAIDKNGRFIFTHLTSTANFGSLKGMGANYSTNKGVNWSATFDVVLDPNCDKNLANSDNSPSSPFYGNTYMAWTSFPPATTIGSFFSMTTNGGVSWTPAQLLNPPGAGHYSQGHDVCVGPNGEVYVVWAGIITTSPFTEDYMSFGKSTNGGANFSVTENVYDINGARSSSFNGWGIRTNGFPRMDVDKSSGPRRGTIYVVSPQINLAPAGTDADVILRKSTDGGATWSSAIRVNQDALNNGKVQYFPCVRVDEAGGVNVVYYDNRDFPSSGDSCTVYFSRSLDGGNTWTDQKIADHNFKPKLLPGVTTMGDYIGVTSGNGKLYAAWMDDKTGSASTLFQTWVGSVTIQLNGLNAFNIQTPAASSRIVTFPGSTTPVTITWDTSTITANYKWIFG
ncbi:MAG: glycoside hydrolase, partial [Ignavibacteria bacterium]|nr:glycoside hydrolase [Ignavibacteria bacterium]